MDAHHSHEGAMLATIKIALGAAVAFIAAVPLLLH